MGIRADGLAAFDDDYGQTKAEFDFIILCSHQATKLKVGENKTFYSTSLIEVRLDKISDIEIHKTSQTEETVYISLSPENSIPFSDRYDYLILPQASEEFLFDPVDYKTKINSTELITKNPNCATLQTETPCKIVLTTVCHSIKCAYKIWTTLTYHPPQPKTDSFEKQDLQFLLHNYCLLYTSDAADDTPCVDLGGRRIIKKKNEHNDK
eukprot:TRINITY_DN16752_c0_g1_i1.p1 TRINITY_DN16752_c0_g1~~TRINITY_DN16752_c0_g1_i1.p1  ORF type:complete len:209 (-),score=33.33 TRINITY_DN16752_c0_g1_i1:78-704(-)